MPTAIQEKIDTNPDVMNAKQAADFLKISPKTLYIMARAGDIPCTILGKTIFRFSRTKLSNLI